MATQDLLEALAAAFNAGDVDAMQALCTDDVEVEGIRAALEGTSYVGSDAMRRFWDDAMEVWSELQIEVEETEIEGNVAVGRGWFSARGRESGVPVRERVVFRFRQEGDRICAVRVLLSTDEPGQPT